MLSTELLAAFRDGVSDTETPYLWSDAEVYRYMNDAQKMFCRLTGGLGDASTSTTLLSYTTASDWIALSPLILKVKSATDSTTGKHIDIVNPEDLRKHGLVFDGNAGTVDCIVLGLEPARVRLHKYPAEAGAIRLTVDRLPLIAITASGPGATLEIAEQHHEHLLLWMNHRAYGKQDAETYNKQLSAEYKFSFEQYCFEAQAEKERALTKVRTVSYGGI